MSAAIIKKASSLVLVDTSVWVEFIRFNDSQLFRLLHEGRVLMHDMVIGEIACGSVPGRAERLSVMNSLPKVDLAEHAEVMKFIDNHQLFGCGVGYVDNHLLAASILHGNCVLWSRDKRLHSAAERLGVAFESALH